jgi:HlyD family secretion protein
MKRLLSIVIALAVATTFVWTLVFLYAKSQKRPVRYETASPIVTDIVRKTVATGNIVPRREVEIKPRVSGIVDKVLVVPGTHVNTGQLLATIEIVPDTARLTQARAAVKSAEINAQNAENELQRASALRKSQIMSEVEFNRVQLEFALRSEELAAARDTLQVIRKGASRSAGNSTNTEVRSTLDGMVLDVPVKEGMSVIESNTFNEGSTVAVIADMNDMIFQGHVDESEVGKIREGMDLKIRVGAIDAQIFDGTLEYIAPKGQTVDGAIQFEIKAAIAGRQDVFIRAGYSANADIVLDRASQVLAIDESLLQFDDGKPFVEVEVVPQRFERRPIEVGISDGIHIQVVNGLTATDTVKGRARQPDERRTAPRGPPRRR